MVFIKKIKMLKFKLPKNIQLNWGVDFIKVEGPLGVIIKRKDDFSLAIMEDSLYLWSLTNTEKENMYMSFVRNLILGVHKGFCYRLKLVGVGFRAAIKDNKVFLKLGFSHEIIYNIPNDVQISCSKAKGIFLLIKGKENVRVAQTAREIKNLRIPDSYKGKGIHYNKEVLKLKKGKREGK